MYCLINCKLLLQFQIDWCVWPPAQFINFYLLPTKFRVVYVATITFFWNTFLSWMKHRVSYSLQNIPAYMCYLPVLEGVPNILHFREKIYYQKQNNFFFYLKHFPFWNFRSPYLNIRISFYVWKNNLYLPIQEISHECPRVSKTLIDK